MSNSFTPSLLLRNGHIQTTLTSLKLRKIIARKRAKEILKVELPVILQCGDSVRLLGAYSENSQNGNLPKGIVILIHGWEGSQSSSYILAASAALYRAGYSIFRLNLRDHGDSHHLNPEPFNSSRLGEVARAVGEVNRLYPHPHSFLAGFSLGGNFVLRTALHALEYGLKLDAAAAISPLIDPLTTTRNMQEKHPVYHHYFVKKWKKSLKKKMQCFPDMDNISKLTELKTLKQMHDYFVPRHTCSSTTEEYFTTYRITPEQMQNLRVPTHIFSADDDPITLASELESFHTTPALTIHRPRYGGHCGFTEDIRLRGWIGPQLVKLFDSI